LGKIISCEPRSAGLFAVSKPKRAKKQKKAKQPSAVTSNIQMQFFAPSEVRSFPSGLTARIRGFHPRGRGSIPRWGAFFCLLYFFLFSSACSSSSVIFLYSSDLWTLFCCVSFYWYLLTLQILFANQRRLETSARVFFLFRFVFWRFCLLFSPPKRCLAHRPLPQLRPRMPLRLPRRG
jgi:hypothetical protein